MRVKLLTVAPAVRALLPVAVVVLVAGPAAADVSTKLKQGLAARSAKVRIAAVSGVARTKDPEARALLEPLLDDAEAAVRAATIGALGGLGDPAALLALERLQADRDASVRQALVRVLPVLEALRVVVDVGGVKDYSGRAAEGALTRLREKAAATLRDALGYSVLVKNGGVEKGYGLRLAIRAVTKSQQGNANLVEVQCEMTLVELPGQVLRLSSKATATAGIEGRLTPQLEAELQRDGIDACAPALAADFIDYARERLRR